jgi:type IV pilus biogenesis protein CpaD/CtpE
MRTYVAVLAACVVAISAGCASPDPQRDAEAQPEKIYRTGSNIPVKDYGAANIEVSKPDPADAALRPGTGIMGRKGGG